ncbi:MAG: GGDEF domain-containing protein [Gammaproteobacteria bacterium]|nr:GGDEF domain-containing protein [Gammaproteobacteria bacterium]
MVLSPPTLEGLPDSPYAAELRKARPSARFAAAMEAEYVRGFLRDNRTLVRLSCTLAVLLLALRGFEVLIGGSSGESSRPAFLGVAGTSLILLWLAWSRGYERRYLPWAHVLIPVRNSIVAAQLVRVAAHGQLDVLTLLPLILLGPFYFMGLQYRTALLVVSLSGASMLASAVVFQLPPTIAFHSGAFALIAIVAFAVTAQQIEKRSRRAFLESRLVAELAQHDVLTWTKNRRMFDEYLPRLWRQAAEDDRSLAILLVDVDHFKPYNDRYGHQAGDAALRKVAQAIQACVRRPLDLVARYGGEEFTAILYDTDGPRASSSAEHIRKCVEALSIEHRGSRAGPVLTVSIGVAVVVPDAGRSPGGALQLADEALYRAKSKGRNRVEIMDEAEYRLLVTGVFPQEVADKLKKGTKH